MDSFGGFGTGSVRDPYHQTKRANLNSILKRGILGRIPSEARDLAIRMDSFKPDGYPARAGSVFLSPGSMPEFENPDWVTVRVDMSSFNPTCYIADLELVDTLSYQDEAEGGRFEELARQYWSEAAVGSLREVNQLSDRYRTPEIVTQADVPPTALYIE